jgi:hypothetical protein
MPKPSFEKETMNDFIYDPDYLTVWVPCNHDADTLVANTDTRHWSEILRAGQLPD